MLARVISCILNGKDLAPKCFLVCKSGQFKRSCSNKTTHNNHNPNNNHAGIAKDEIINFCFGLLKWKSKSNWFIDPAASCNLFRDKKYFINIYSERIETVYLVIGRSVEMEFRRQIIRVHPCLASLFWSKKQWRY